MTEQLEKSLNALNDAHAQELPSVEVVEAAEDGATWEGTKSDGSPWKLTKNNSTSYNVHC